MGATSEILIEPKYTGLQCTAGKWQHPPRGNGETGGDDNQDASIIPDNGHWFPFGVLVGNWGGKFKVKEEDEYLNKDIHHTACGLLM